MSKLFFSFISRTGLLIVEESGRKNKEKVRWVHLESAQSFRECLWLRRHISCLLRAPWASKVSHRSLRHAMTCHSSHWPPLRSRPLFRLPQHRITGRSPFSHILLASQEHRYVRGNLLLHLVYLQSRNSSTCHTNSFIHHFLVQQKWSLSSRSWAVVLSSRLQPLHASRTILHLQ